MQIITKHFWRWYGIFLLCLSTWYWVTQWTAVQALAMATEPLTPDQHLNLPSTSVAIIFFIIAFIIVTLSFTLKKSTASEASPMVIPWFLSWGLATLILLESITYLFLTPRTALWNVAGRFALIVLVAGIGAWLLSITRQPVQLAYGFSMLLLIAGSLYRIGIFIPEIQSTPFALGWSEGSRYYNASLFFSESIYGSKFALPVLHPSRYLLQAIAFLFAPGNILVHRIWQVILWIGITGLGAISIVKRVSPKNRPLTIALTLWLFLFFFQGAVYYHLMVCVLMIMLGYNKDAFWKTFIVILISSVWAGLSRVNWYPVPALLAVCLYLIEEPVRDHQWIDYLKKPVIWTISGLAVAFLTNRIYAGLSGNDVSQFSSSFTSYMVWSRLIPNSTYPPGILLAVLLVSLPVIFLMWFVIRRNGWKFYWHWIRVFGLSGIIFIFAMMGIFVSVKIGGGGDLHNMDAFLIFLAVISTHVIFNRFTPQTGMNFQAIPIPFLFIIIVICVPVYFSFLNSATWKLKDQQLAKANVQLIQKAVDVVNEKLPGPILFIAERQLLTFGNITGVELVPDYEKVFLMEMVMSNNSIYLDNFHSQLENHDYSVIVFDTLWETFQKKEDSFWVENNLWVDKVIVPILESYEPVYSFLGGSVNILIPRKNEDLYNQLKRMTP